MASRSSAIVSLGLLLVFLLSVVSEIIHLPDEADVAIENGFDIPFFPCLPSQRKTKHASKQGLHRASSHEDESRRVELHGESC